ncbi:MAG: MerR family transcriptional regulator [Clostridia bacterium]|nr:MerR family transcriptional regulator [Clostridia bacterium]
MRMKDICQRTGLTDRAVRLYIENGLLSPKRENRYSGHNAIIFDEEDVQALEVVATLRRAEFSIADIKQMQQSPACIPDLLVQHQQRLRDEIRTKQQVLASLQKIGDTGIASTTALADHLRLSAPYDTPIKPIKEVPNMTLNDIKRIIRARIPSLLALIAMLVGALTLIPLCIKTAFGELTLASGGGFDLNYSFTAHDLPFVLASLTVAVCILAALICTFVYLTGKGRSWLWVGLGGCLLAAFTLLILPAEVRNQLYRFEFLAYRHSFFHEIFYQASEGFDIFLRSLKFIPPAAGALCAAIGLWREAPLTALPPA